MRWSEREEKRKMSGKPKTILRNFGYRECDAFAAYLRRQSLRGWHFKEWNLGLVFEPGEARDVIYDVQVFPKGKEKDTKPESDALEYAGYCEAAGWELAEGKKQFCIFRKCKEDAVPIVTEEEKFQNICRAEWKRWLRALLGYGGILAIFLYTYVLSPWALKYLYNNVLMFAVCVTAIRFVWRLADGVWLLFWTFRQKRRLTTEGKAVYDKAGLEKGILIYLREILLLAILLLMAYQAGFGAIFLPVVLTLMVVYFVRVVFSYVRPDRADAWMEPLVMAGVVYIALILITVVLFAGGWGHVDTLFQLETLPLVQADYEKAEGQYDVIENFHQTGVLGQMAVCGVQYRSGEDRPLLYEVYESEIPWVVMHTWKCKIKEIQARRTENTEFERCAEQWGALEAFQVNDGYYLIRYEDSVWAVRTGETLNAEQIWIIREKLSAL